MPKVMVISGDEAGMIGEIVSVKNSDVTIKVAADGNALYTFKFDQLRVIEDEGLDKMFDDFIEPDILKRLEIESKIDWEIEAEVDYIFNLIEKGFKL